MQYCVVYLTCQLPNEIYIIQELCSSSLNGCCLRSRCTLCCNSFFMPRQCINFMSQQATTGSLCRAKQCLIGFQSMATPPEACFHLLFQQHLERNGGDYIPPVVSRWFSPRRPLGIRCWQSRSMMPCCPVRLLANPELLLLLLGVCVTALLRQAGSKEIMIIQTKLIVYSANSGIVEIPNTSRKTPFVQAYHLNGLLQSKLNLLWDNFYKNTSNSLLTKNKPSVRHSWLSGILTYGLNCEIESSFVTVGKTMSPQGPFSGCGAFNHIIQSSSGTHATPSAEEDWVSIQNDLSVKLSAGSSSVAVQLLPGSFQDCKFQMAEN